MNLSVKTSRIIFAGLFCLLLTVSVFSETLAKYRTDVEYARKLTLRLLNPDKAVTGSPESYLKFETETVAEIRQALPAKEQIEWEGNSLETDNGWIHEQLSEFEKEERGSAKRAEILTGISERLDSIENKIKQIEIAIAAARTKDEDKRKLAEILNREEYQKPTTEDESIFQRLYRQISEWLGSLFPEPKVPDTPVSGFRPFSFILQMLLYALVLGVIGFVIYKFAPHILGRFRRRREQEKTDRVILGERLAPDQDAAGLFQEAERLAREGNLRGAIRQGYIALLCELSDRKLIGLSRHKTNRDYLRDVRGKRELYQNMNGLTLNFERHWYGFEAAEEGDWEEFKSGYEKALQ